MVHCKEKRGLKYPILQISSNRERQIFNTFMASKCLTDSNLKVIAHIFRDSANGVDDHFKLPSMLKSYAKTWTKNNEISAKEKGLGSVIHQTLAELLSKRTSELVQDVPPTKDALALSNNNDEVMFEIVDEEEIQDAIGESVDENTPQSCIFVGAFQALKTSYMPLALSRLIQMSSDVRGFQLVRKKERNSRSKKGRMQIFQTQA